MTAEAAVPPVAAVVAVVGGVSGLFRLLFPPSPFFVGEREGYRRDERFLSCPCLLRLCRREGEGDRVGERERERGL